ncbi:hypothetical protein J6590_041538 [Homalodisca vitripennis]|nr:hypothetical protein J6590_041538 [Homalodisca vitripennis]
METAIDPKARDSNSATNETCFIEPAIQRPDVDDLQLAQKNAILCAFSLKTNVTQMLSTRASPTALTCLNGLRVLAIFWIMTGHRMLQMLSFPKQRGRDVYEVLDGYSWAPVESTQLAVEIFFLISGILVTYGYLNHKLKGLKFNIPTFYLHRYLRLTPPLAAIVLLYGTLAIRFTDGPLWRRVFDRPYYNCRHNWWATLLYVNNYYDPYRMCVSQSWFVSSDFQLYLFSPILLIPLHKRPKMGLALTAMFVLITTMGGLWNAIVNDLKGGMAVSIYVELSCTLLLECKNAFLDVDGALGEIRQTTPLLSYKNHIVIFSRTDKFTRGPRRPWHSRERLIFNSDCKETGLNELIAVSIILKVIIRTRRSPASAKWLILIHRSQSPNPHTSSQYDLIKQLSIKRVWNPYRRDYDKIIRVLFVYEHDEQTETSKRKLLRTQNATAPCNLFRSYGFWFVFISGSIQGPPSTTEISDPDQNPLRPEIAPLILGTEDDRHQRVHNQITILDPEAPALSDLWSFLSGSRSSVAIRQMTMIISLLRDRRSEDATVQDYIVTHWRAASFLIGMALGYFLFKIKQGDIALKLSRAKLWAGWMISTFFILFVVIFVTVLEDPEYVPNAWVDISYMIFHRHVFTLGIVWIVLVCTLGHGGWVNQFLSWNTLIPFARLSYGAFLTHLLIQTLENFSQRVPISVSHKHLWYHVAGDFTLTYIASAVLYLTVEGPCSNITNWCFQDQRKTKENLQNHTELPVHKEKA